MWTFADLPGDGRCIWRCFAELAVAGGGRIVIVRAAFNDCRISSAQENKKVSRYAAFGFACGWIGQNGWMQGDKTATFIVFSGKNALKHVFIMVGTESLLRMTLPAMVIGGIGGGIYGRVSEFFNPNGNFIGI